MVSLLSSSGSNQGHYAVINQSVLSFLFIRLLKTVGLSQTVLQHANGETTLGLKNALIGFMTWEGYNYEDAVLINEKWFCDDVYTSIHIEEHGVEARDTKAWSGRNHSVIFRNVGEDALKDLDEDGIIRVGAEVHSSSILVGKVTPKGETELTAEERLLRAIFGEKQAGSKRYFHACSSRRIRYRC